VLLALLGIGYLGYTLYPKYNKCPDIASDTILIKDTVIHYIPDSIPYYIVQYDSIVYHDTVFKNVDTAEILKDYFATHFYTRNWTDSLLTVTLKDQISRNSFGNNVFSYKILRDQQVINNVINNVSYSRYITFGVDVPFKQVEHMNLNIDVLYVTNRYYLGIGYNSELNCPTIKGGIPVFRFK
jgi:hypothetical protein